MPDSKQCCDNLEVNKEDKSLVVQAEENSTVSIPNVSIVFQDTIFQTNQILISILKDKVYRLFKDFTSEYDLQYEQAVKLAKSGHEDSKNDEFELSVNTIWRYIYKLFTDHTKSMTKYVRDLPGFDKLEPIKQLSIANECFFSGLGLKLNKLYIDGECYLTVDNVNLKRKHTSKLMGPILCNDIFDHHEKIQSLNLTDNEISLLVPYIFSLFCKLRKQISVLSLKTKELNLKFIDLDHEFSPAIKSINNYYTSILFYEFKLNNRDNAFFSDLYQVNVFDF